MSPEALLRGVDFAGGSVADFLGNLEGRIGVNMALYVGHAALRRLGDGADASERTATEAEIRSMQDLLDTGMRQGAIGFSTSQLDVHADHEGKPVPPNLASADEIVALSSVLAGYEEGVIEHLCRSFALGYDSSDRELLARMAEASGGKALHANILLRFTGRPDVWRECLDVLEGYARDGLRVYPMASANPKGIHIALRDTIMLDEMPTFRSTLSAPMDERVARLRDPGLRDRLRGGVRRHRRPPVRVRLVGAAGGGGARRVPRRLGRAHGQRPERRRGGSARHLPRPRPDRGPRDGVRRRPARHPGGPRRHRLPVEAPAHHARLERRRRPPEHLLRGRLHDADPHRVRRPRRVLLRGRRPQAHGRPRRHPRAVGPRRHPARGRGRPRAVRPRAARRGPGAHGERPPGRRRPAGLRPGGLRGHDRERRGDRRPGQAHGRRARRRAALQPG